MEEQEYRENMEEEEVVEEEREEFEVIDLEVISGQWTFTKKTRKYWK